MRSKRTIVKNDVGRLARIKGKIDMAKVKFWEKKQVSLQSARLVADFKRLLDTQPEAFDDKYARFTARLEGSKYYIVKKIEKFMENNLNVCIVNIDEVEQVCHTCRQIQILSKVFSAFTGHYWTKLDGSTIVHIHERCSRSSG